MKILIAAGEVSGDKQAAHLARALHAAQGDVELYGIGGHRMAAAGVDLRLKTTHLGSVGFQESLRYVRPLRAVRTQVAEMVRSEPPDLAILVDNEGFNQALARTLRKRDIPIALYFAPQVWFWGKRRARSIARWARLIVPAFRAEAEIYRSCGGHVSWFGHPLVDLVRTADDPRGVVVKAGLDPDERMIALLPGSRAQEVEALTPPMLRAARILRDRDPKLQIILPLAAPHLRPTIERELSEARLEDHVKLVTDDVYTLLSRCEMALMSSGTATLEATLLDLPFVAAYRLSRVTYFLARRLVEHEFMAMPNILSGERVVPELHQGEANGGRMADEASAILENAGRAAEIRGHLADVRATLGEKGVVARAAEKLLSVAGSGESECED